MNTAGQSWIVLNNGVKMPQFGLGVWQTENGQQVIDAVKAAVNVGYRAIDTAAAYENEDGVGQGIRECGLDRNELFITSKLWNSDQGYDNTLRAFDKTMERLGLDVLDLYLIHWPCPNDGLFVETWKAFETLYKQGRVRAIGLSNFTKENIQTLLDSCEIKPMVNQIECHPYLTQVEMQSFLFQNQIAMTAWLRWRMGKCLAIKPCKRSPINTVKTSRRLSSAGNCNAALSPFRNPSTPSASRKTFRYLILFFPQRT